MFQEETKVLLVQIWANITGDPMIKDCTQEDNRHLKKKKEVKFDFNI